MKNIKPIFAFLLLCIADPAHCYDDFNGYYHGKDRQAEYRDGPCQVKEESKPDEYKVEIKCKDGRGAHWRGEWKEEFQDGPCKVKREAKWDEFKEEVKCDHDD